MESEDQPLPRNLYHTLYYVTHQNEDREALTEFIDLLQARGYSMDFIETLQFTLFPTSRITGHIAVSAQYWS